MRRALAWLLVALCAAWVAIRLLGLERGFPLVPLVAFTPLAAAGALAVVVVVALLRELVPALVAAVLALALVATVVPRALGGPTEPDGRAGPALRVASANMHFGTGSADALVALVRRERIDVLSVQELTPGLARRLDGAGLAELLPERVGEPRRGGSGIVLYANVPLAGFAVPGRRRNPLAAASVRVPGGPEVQVVAVHPPPPQSRWSVAAWKQDLRALPAATPDGPLRILAGDFNATLDHAELRRLLDTGYEDAAAEVGAGLRATWPHGRRLPPPVAIDHVLADRRCGVRAFSVHPIPGTDHRAVVAEVVLPR
ncbi:MAG TPA: endonuclease/exonuclease/phosphatase family protein [Solirubrobacteraceae bacterium]|nr:endonuclease/exonuclease/phosphatase family protein [Solirubrobacteraceae bacterium]